MPRPKVKPEDRQRSARACVPCKASKIRCDAAVPCGPCSKRDKTSSCVYVESSRKRQKTEFGLTAAENEDTSRLSQRGAASESPPRRDSDVDSDAAVRTASALPGREGQAQVVSKLTQSRMLLSSKGEKVFVGESASLSFLQFLRQILRNYMGPSPFTENMLRDSMLEVDTVHDESPVRSDQSRGEKLALVQMYREATSGILDLYTVEEMGHLLDHHNALSPSHSIDSNSTHSRADQAALNMMLAIGCQCRGKKPTDQYNAARSFTCAQKFAFEGFLCDPSIDMVRVFTMMAFYMAQACHRNAVYMYTGIASKAACALGLHRKEQYIGLSQQECLTRWRTWKSVLILDTITSAILGRPGGIPTLRPDDATSYDDSEEMAVLNRPHWLASRALFAICSHLIELQQSLGNDSNVDIATAERFLQRLRRWNESLPAELRRFELDKSQPLGPAERELLMGATHVSCLYYFTTILVTRPFLISHLMSTIAQRQAVNGRPLKASSPDHSKVSDLAQACLDSALFLAKTGYMAITSSFLSNNMCLLKAWMFAAGLVLGFSMFIDSSDPVHDIDEAFGQAMAVLERLAEASPQAKHYLEILTTLSEAINERRKQLSRERRRKSGRYVSQIFTTDLPGSNSSLALEATPSSVPSNDSASANLNSLATYEFNPADLDLLDFSAQLDAWNDIPLLSDNLYFDWGDGDGWTKNLL